MAGGLYVVGVTAWVAVHSVQLKKGETVVVSGAAGGVGSLAVQLARRTGATVIGLSSESNHEWPSRIRAAAPGGVDAFIDTHGDGYVELALAIGVAPERIDTIADFAAAGKYGAKTGGGAAARPGAKVLAELAGLFADGHLELPIANVYPLTQGSRGIHRARAQPHPRQDRPQAIVARHSRMRTPADRCPCSSQSSAAMAAAPRCRCHACR